MKKHAWVFTINNYSEEEIPCYSFIDENTNLLTHECRWGNPLIVYVVHGKEVSASGTRHLQGAIVFKRPVGLRTLKACNNRAHWEPMRGTFTEACDYCEKDGDVARYWSIHKYGTLKAVLSKCKDLVKEDHETVILDKRNEISLSQLFDTVEKLSLRQDVLEQKLTRLIEVTQKMIELRQPK